MTETPNLLFETYKLLVEEAREARRVRRDLSNTFLTINVVSAGGLGGGLGLELSGGDRLFVDATLFAPVTLALIIVNFIWIQSNRYYWEALRVKYAIISEYENQIGVNPLQEEYLRTQPLQNKRMFTFERAMPWVFIATYVAFLCYQFSMDDVRAVLDIVQTAWRSLADRFAQSTG